MAAGLTRRLAAMLYDALLIGGLLMLVGFVAVAIDYLNADLSAPRPVRGWGFQLALLLTSPLYCAGFWARAGQTPGMRAWGIALHRDRVACLSFGRGLLRCALAAMSLLCFGLGYAWCLIDARSRAWHDIWSGSQPMRLTMRR